ncbi:PREDICTED: uncharacterized protein LOC106790976 [Polistes canadensis]|uniref:uncharacterized protein LOC106790976 n=1 Tax=Polistes canadensis TaxID=91411 RepID=UPI000718C3FB|nr:PREDICTED: uncharacterized protein LOC106790976 [Polistes canadensis]
MMEVYPALPKFRLQECQDEDDLTDIDDEVFIRDGKNGGLKLDEDGVVKRPLMAPRKKYRKFYKVGANRFPYKTLFISICYVLIALVLLLGLIILCISTANIFPLTFTMLKKLISHELEPSISKMHVIPCTSLSSKIIWSRRISKFSSVVPLRSFDVNKDGIEDIIVGFNTGANEESTVKCHYFIENSLPCLGQILALDGKTGDTLWIYWPIYGISSIDCGLDITNDKINDCIASVEGGVLYAINGKTGIKIWIISDNKLSDEHSTIFRIFDAKFITDTDRDGIGDVIVTGYTVQSDLSRRSKILIVSGKKGKILYTIDSPKLELFSLPQTIVYPDGENIFVLTANNQMQSGTLYIASSANFMHGNLKLKELHHSSGKAALLPLVLVDITLDGIADIVAPMFDSTIIAYDGLTFNPIWNYTVPNSEILSSPIPGYYNDDNIPDFMIKHKVENEGFPKYYYTISMIIDGHTGQPLLEKPIEDILNKQVSGLSVTVDGFGNDWFLHWFGNCLHDKDFKGAYQFSKKENFQTHTDLCKMKLNSTTTKLLALSQLVEPPGIILYSEEYDINNSVDIEKEIDKYLESYHYEDTIDIDTAKIYKDYDKGEIFKHNRDEDILEESANYNQKPPEMTYANHQSNFEGDNRFDNNFQLSNMENIDTDNSLYRKNKNLENIKEYDEGDEPNNDYLPIGDLREQRRQVNNNDKTSKDYVINDNKYLFSSKVRNKRIKKSNNILNKSINYSKQREQSSGILLPSFINSKKGNSVDLIFTTSGSPLLETSITLSQEDLKCIYRNKVSAKNSMHHRKNADIIKECLNEHDDNYNLFEKSIKEENIIIALGQMTVYRMKLECVCPEDMLPNQVCKSIASKQSWSEYLGLYGSGYFRPLHRNT